MKILKKSIMVLFVALLASCASNDDPALSGEGSFSAKVDGNLFEAFGAAVVATVTNNVAAIQGSNTAGDYIRINITNYTGVGTYKTGDAISNPNMIIYGQIQGSGGWASTFNLGNGTINITEDTSTTLKGTFSFTGINSQDNNSSKTITEGTFSAPKQ